MVRPFCRLGTGSPQHPFANLVDEADFLGERDEFGWAYRPAFWVIPADQRLEAGNLFARAIDARLIGQVQLSLFHCDPQVRFQKLTLASGLMHFRREEAVA